MSCSKMTFMSKKLAIAEINLQKAARNRFSRRAGTSKNNKKIYTYECHRCGLWHLTTQKKRKY